MSKVDHQNKVLQILVKHLGKIMVSYLSVTTSYVVTTKGIYLEAPIISAFKRKRQWNWLVDFAYRV